MFWENVKNVEKHSNNVEKIQDSRWVFQSVQLFLCNSANKRTQNALTEVKHIICQTI